MKSGRMALPGALVVAGIATVCGAPAAADPAAGRTKALTCQACHGLDGTSRLAEAPNLSGQVEQYLVKALQDYRSGARKNEMMTIMAGALKDEEIADLAAWYAAVKITVQKP